MYRVYFLEEVEVILRICLLRIFRRLGVFWEVVEVMSFVFNYVFF